MIPNVCKARSTCRSFIKFLILLTLIRIRAADTTTSFDTHITPSEPEISIVDELPVSSTAIASTIFGLHHHQQTYQTPQLPPFKFQHRVYNVSIRENSVGKTYAVQPTNEARMGMGISSAPDIDIKYRIIAGDKDKLFKAEDRTVGDFTFLAIRTRTGNVVLNREKIDSYHLKVRATGTRRDYKTKIVQEDECIVNVIVLDTNDLSPLFYPNEYAITVPEDMALHQNIVKVMAEDADLGINGEIYYSFLEETDWFSVHPTSGVISLTRPLKYIEKSLHELIVIANDRGNSPSNRHSQPSKAKVKIRVKQVNLHAPEIYVQALPDILENSNANIYGIVRVEDKDIGIHGKIKILDIVDGDPDGHFRIRPTSNPGEFNIEVHRLLDRERTPNGYNLTLRAVDAGTPPQQSYKVIPVRLADTNDNAPVFNREIYEVIVPETAPPNTPVIRLKVTDRDEGKNAMVSLEIVGGNEGGEFRVNAETGMLYTAVPLDAELKAFYTLTVSAIDQGNTGTRKQSSAKVKINVQDTNDNDPVFEQANVTIWVDENDPAGTTVTKVLARDRDSGENAYISYSLANLNEVPFDIDHFSGTVRTTKLIDYESMRREYVLKVRASDWGLPYRRQTEMSLTIKVRDVNDNRPQFERIDCVGSVARSAAIGTEILTLSAIDFDADNFISYRLVSGNEDGCFNMDATSGTISVGCDLNDVRVKQRFINVTATDGHHFADVMPVEIHLLNSSKITTPFGEIGKSYTTSNSNSRYNTASTGSFQCKETGVARRHAEMLALAESNNVLGTHGTDTHNSEELPMMPIRYGENVHAPEFIDFPNEIFINETVRLGTTVTWIKARDRDLGYNGKIVFGISSGDNDSVFRLDPESGELKIIGYLDRERTDEYVLNVTIYDLGNPQKTASKVLPVVVLDENDNAPVFEKTLASFRVTENALNGTIILRLNATDSDLGENARITYSLVTDTNDFRVDPETGVLFISSPLDRERQELYELQIRASDNGQKRDQPQLFSDAIVRVIIEDVNDNAPEFNLKEYNIRIREDIPVHTVVAITTATDLDTGPGGEVMYSLSDDIDQSFKIDKYTGTIRTIKALDFEERQIHSLTVRAIDRGTPAISSETSVIIEIIDVNENRFAPQFDDFVLSGSVAENSPAGTHVMVVTAKDSDAPGPDSRISYSIRGGDGLGVFTVDNEGAIRTTSILDLETKPHYWLTVCAQDQAVVPLYSCVEVFIQIENVNDNAPLTEHPVYYPSVAESSPAGVKVLQLIAEDGDNDPLQKITYRITSGNPEGFFAINSTSGLITTTARKLDRENQSEHILEVMLMDNGIPQLSSTTRIVITVDDINDHSPEFDEKFYKVQIPANAKVDQALFQVLAIDQDTGENGRVTYSIKSGKGKAKFRINADTGVIYAAKPFESDAEYDIIVRAEDNGLPKKSQTTRMSVIVVDTPTSKENANPPQIKTSDQRVEVTENDNPGFLVTLIQAYDEDNDQLWFDIIDGDENNDFFIGRDNGKILLAKNLDWERKRDYNITIGISDGVHAITTQLYISVIDINDQRPEFSEPVYIVQITENTAEGTEILKLHATDLDEDKTLFYSLHAARNPSSLKLFRIDSVTGSVTLAQELDRELIAEHVLIVIVKDHGTPAKRNYAKVIVHVHDHNDHAPEFTSKIIQGKVYETATIGSNIVTAYATDRDIGENGRIVYSIVSGNVGNIFAIDSAMGTISVAKELSTNAMSEYMLQVKATDCGNPALFAQIPVQVIVVMVDNAPPKFTRTEMAVEIYENLPIGTFVMHIEARSTSSVQFAIINGNIDDTFFINPSTGIITTKDLLDYEKTKFYNLTIRATNMASVSATSTAIIHILDRNDNAPYFTQQLYKGEISESAPIASLILAVNDTLQMDQSIPLVIKAYDIDAGLNSHLHYDIVETMPRRYFHIDSTTGAIKTVMLLDHEKIPLFTFHVKVSDLGKPRLSSEIAAKVQINITDVNDCPPVFTQPEYNVTLLLPTYQNVAVLQVNATDRDENGAFANGSALRYEIVEDSNKDGVFAINSHTGVITTRNVERIGEFYKLLIRVTDGKFTNSATVNIRVETSENSGLVFQKPVYEGSILENSTKIVTVTVVNVIGAALNEHIEFRLLNPTDMFRIGMTSGAVVTTGIRFDREEQQYHELIVEARSYSAHRERPRVAHVIVNVTILDVNDNCPMFVNLPYYAIVSVDAERGSLITKVHALDADAYENGEVRYEMKRGHGELFKVDRKTGEVTLKQTLEGHNRDFELLIAAYDGGITPFSTDVTVHVKVIDKSMPVFSKQFYSDIVPENIELHTPLSVAIQAESPLGRKLIYTIVKGNELEEFSVDFNTGAIYVVDDLDYERRQHYELVIRATDSVSGVSAEVPVSVLVQDVNDCLPEFEMDSYNVTVSEGASFGTAILKVVARDNDTGVNQMVTYGIQTDNKNTSEYFQMDPLEGVVYLKKSLDHEQLAAHHFTVIAIDKGVPSLSSTAHVWVKVMDMNDNPPKFEQSSYSCSLSQHAVRGQFVTIISASDPDYIDADNLMYSIAEGNELQTYAIDPISGIITLINMQNFAENHSTILNVSVSDSVYTSFIRVQINILPANLHNPVFPHLVYDVKINENQMAGRLVITVNAIDEDFGEYGQLTYDIFSDEMKEFFSIDKTKGEIVTKVRLDREEQKMYEVPIIATDGGGRSGFTTVKIRVGDFNDIQPKFYLREYKTSIYGNLTVNATFLNIKAFDADENQNSVIKYSIYDTQNTGVKDLFSIDEDTGAMYLSKTAARLENQMFQFFVRAHDGGSPSLHADVSVDVYIMSQSDVAPNFEKKERVLFLAENSPAGTVITRLKLTTTNATAKYRIASESNLDAPQFTILDDGELRLAKALDRETKDTHYIGIYAESDSSPSLTAFCEILLHVQDENDNSPIFESTRYHLQLAENIEKGSTIMKVTARDADTGSNGDIRYMFDSDAGEILNIFDIDVHTGAITTLVLLDREQIEEYHFRVIATDNGQPKRSGETMVSIKLIDYNDCAPTFKNASYSAKVSEDALPGTVLLQLSTIDRDKIETPVDFYILSTDSQSQSVFQIRNTGELYVAKELDRETIPNYTLDIIATDGTFTTHTNVTIEVIDANDNPPYCLKYRYEETLSEGVHVGTFILSVLATDADEAENAKLRFYLTGDGDDDFILDESSGHLRTARQLDRETQSRYHLVAHVQDHFRSWECSSQIEIILSDLNDNAPVFSLPIYTISLPEDAEIGTLVTKMHATDADIGINRKINYTFIDSHKDHFKIVPDSGIITLAKPLDREEKEMYNLTVQAFDHGDPRLTSMAYVIVNVQDINDNPPEFTSKYYAASITEDSPIGSEVIRVLATSKDTGLNAIVKYSFIGGNEQRKFQINNETGVIFVADTLDYERVKDYFLTIQAVDLGEPPLSNLATLNISVIDCNDNRPQFTQSSYSARIREDSVVGDKILQVQANDLDSAENGHISYSIVRGDRLQQFSVEKSTGYVSVAAALDRESISSYVLEIEALDNGMPPLSSYSLLNIEISDANDNPPLFTQPNYTAFVQEDKPIGHVLLRFDVTDADAAPNAEPFTFDIITKEAAFVVQQDGILRTATRFNHKVKDSYLLQVRVFDNGTPLLHSDTWVQVNVIEESQYPPVIVPQDISINAFGDVFQGGPIGTIFASDQDQYDTLTYDLAQTSGVLYTPKSLFNISRTNGTLYALPKLDVGDYRVNVTVTDGKFTVFTIIKISVDLVTDEMLENAVLIRFTEVTPEQFVLSHRKTFIRSIRNAIGTRLKDIVIISVQTSADDSNTIHRYNRDLRNISMLLDSSTQEMRTDSRNRRQLQHDLDVLFAVRKHQINPNTLAYYSSDEIRTLLDGKISEIEKLTELSVDEIVQSKCSTRYCDHGKCEDKIQLDPTKINTISTDVSSFVSAHFEHTTRCRCDSGYGGDKCENSVNDCASNPCPVFKICVPDLSPQGYYCICPKGFGGPSCDKDIIKCTDDSCYLPKNPVTFNGKSYIQYRMEKAAAKKALEEHLVFSLRIRTVQPTANLMYASGKIDFSILEIQNGVVQYRFDLGSGEGLISVTSIYVSDGQWHDIRLEREGNSGRLVVDGKHVAQGNAPGVNGVLNLQSSDMYLGAEVKQHPSVLGFEDIQHGFVGCMDDINLSRIPLTIHNPGTTNTVAILKRTANIEFSCDASLVLKPLGICGTAPCLNGGTCKDNGGDSFECICHSRFTGKLCAVDTDPCASNPCLFGGKCRAELLGNYTCECPPRMTGKRCDFGRFCSPNPCRNGGVCEEGDNGPLCMCRGYMGPTCEIDVDECEKMPCGSGATCINEAGSFRCICPPDLTGASCGDPLYSNSITSKLKNIPMEQIIGVISGISVIFFVLVVFLSCRLCKRHPTRSHTNNINNDTRKEGAMLVGVTRDNGDFKRNSKMSNIEISQRNEQRPTSFTSGNEANAPYACNNVFVNNLDTLRSYGSAGDELENVPPEFRKPTRINQHVNLNGHSAGEADSKQTWSDYLQLQSFTDNKINNDLKRASPISSTGSEHRCATLKSSGVLQGRLLNVPLPNPTMQYQTSASTTANSGLVVSNSEDSNSENHGEAYHWDCSDWVRRSHNPLPNITEVPGSEVPDSSSFHSNESNESQCKQVYQTQRVMADQKRTDASVTEEEIDTEFNDSEFESGDRGSIAFTVNSSIPTSNPLDSSSDDYRFASAETYLKHPNSYLPKYNVNSETDGETTPLNAKGINRISGELNAFESEEELDDQIEEEDEDEDDDDDDQDIPAYGFPRNRREPSDIDFIINNADENSSLLRQHRKNAKPTAMKSNFKDELNTSNTTTASSSSASSGGKSVKWANNIQTTQV